MKKLIFSLAMTPFVSYFLTLLSLAIVNSFISPALMRDHLDNNAFPVWIAWIAVSCVAVILKHIFVKRQE